MADFAAWRGCLKSEAFDYVVSWRNGKPVNAAQFDAQVAIESKKLKAVNARAIAIFHNDSLQFAVLLLAAWRAGKTVYLPGDVLEQTCLKLQEYVGAFVGEFAPNFLVLDSSLSRAVQAAVTDQAGLVVFTSGSSGEPIGIAKSYTQLFSEVQTLEKTFGAKVGDACISASVSHQHIYGLLFKVLWPLAAGRSFAAQTLTYPENMLELLRLKRCAIIASPAHLKRLPATLEWTNVSDNLAAIFSSAGPLSLEAAMLCEKLLGQAPIEIYGSSETGGVAYRQRTAGIDRVWQPLPNVSVRAMQGTDCLEIQSAHLPDQQWYASQDRVEFDSLGSGFKLLGRADQIVKIEGKRVSLALVENSLRSNINVADVKVVALTSVRDELGAVIVLSEAGEQRYHADGITKLIKLLREDLVNFIERSSIPRRFRFLASLPSDAQGKVTQAALQKLFTQSGSSVLLPIYQISAQTVSSLELALEIPRDLAFFDGHFDRLAVVPGVTIVHWMIEFSRRYLGVTQSFIRMDQVKFRRLLRPGARVQCVLRLHPDNSSATFLLSAVSDVLASGRIVFGNSA